MHDRAAEIVAAARECLGTRFRVQGRQPGLGLDCVGVGLYAAGRVGIRIADQRNYSLTGDSQTRLDSALAEAGCQDVSKYGYAPGDFLIFAPRPHQRHLTIRTENGIIHADLRAGLVVENALPTDWPIVGAWRLP